MLLNLNSHLSKPSPAIHYPIVDREHAINNITLIHSSYWVFFRYIERITDTELNEEEKKLITTHFKIKKLRKRQYLLQEGDVCRYKSFLLRGAMRMFGINERGQESIIQLGLENSWMVDQESFRSQTPSIYHIEALEDCEMLLICKAQLQELMKVVPALGLMFHEVTCSQLILAQNRINAALSMSAEERYSDLLASFPEYNRRFSQNLIARYLGIKPETLSRVRKKV